VQEVDSVQNSGSGTRTVLHNSDEFENEGLISLTEMNKILEGFQCSSKIFFTDACRNLVEQEGSVRSGEILSVAETKSAANQPMIRGGLPNMTEIPKNIRGFHRIASCSINEVSHELPTLKHGVFTNFLINGLTGADDGNGDGKITLQELFDFAGELTSETVSTYVSKEFSQNPTYSKTEVTGNFVIGYCKPKESQDDIVKQLEEQLKQKEEELQRQKQKEQEQQRMQQSQPREGRINPTPPQRSVPNRGGSSYGGGNSGGGRG